MCIDFDSFKYVHFLLLHCKLVFLCEKKTTFFLKQKKDICGLNIDKKTDMVKLCNK